MANTSTRMAPVQGRIPTANANASARRHDQSPCSCGGGGQVRAYLAGGVVPVRVSMRVLVMMPVLFVGMRVSGRVAMGVMVVP